MSSPRLLDQVRDRLRVKHYSMRTEDTYLQWIRRFIFFHGKKHPREMGGPQVEAFLSHLATVGRVAASTQNQALSALLFLYREVLRIELPWMENVIRAKRPRRVPTVLSQDEVRRLLASMEGRPWLPASLLYGTGMRLMECLRLRVKDIDFGRAKITIRDGKGEGPAHDAAIYGDTRPLSPGQERNGVASADRVEAGRGSDALHNQLDLFVAAQGNGESDTPVVTVNRVKLAQSAKLIQTGQFHSGVERVETLADQAHILAPLRKSAQEQSSSCSPC